MTIKNDLGFNTEEEFDLNRAVDYYLNNKEERVSKERDYFYMSELGSSKKELFKKLKNQTSKSKTDAKLHRVFANGDGVHERYMKWFAEMGILIGAEIEVNTDLIHGRCDAIISDGEKNYVVEIKSINTFSFSKLNKPIDNHLLQLLCYMYFLKIKDGIILYEDKNLQSIKTFNIQLDEKNKNIIEKYIKELEILKEHIINNTEPDDEPLILETLEYR